MAAEDGARPEPAATPPKPGGLKATKGGLPIWTWAVMAGLGLGVLWVVSRHKSQAGTTSTAPAAGDTIPTTIVPVDQGLAASQYAAILAAIHDLQNGGSGKGSGGGSGSGGTTKPPPKHKPKFKTYVIRRGDTLTDIAEDEKVSLSVLKRLNPGLFNRAHKGGNLIHPGERVKIPA